MQMKKSAFVMQQAEAYSFVSDAQIERKDDGTANLGFIRDGSYAVYRTLDFASGAAGFSVQEASNTESGTIEIRIGSPTGKLLGSCEIPNTGGWQEYETFTCKLGDVSDVQDICLVFKGGSDYLLNVDSFVFTGIKGDANCDGQIDARDLTLAKRVMLIGDESILTPLGRSNADYDGNGDLNAADAKGIRDYLLGK